MEKKLPISIFNIKSPFFILNVLKNYNGIIKLDLLKQVNAKLDFTWHFHNACNGSDKNQFAKAKMVTFIKMYKVVQTAFDKMMGKNYKAFADQDETFNITLFLQ